MVANRKSSYIKISLLIAGVSAPVLVMIMLLAGITTGEEFSPDDFTRRHFFYNRIPIVKWTLFGKSNLVIPDGVGSALVGDGLVKTVTNTPQVWHLSNDSGDGQHVSHDCDARFLVKYLDMTESDGGLYWEKWNSKFPETAKILWPVVADMARDEMYLKIPDIMRLATDVQKDKPASFETSIRSIAASAYAEMAAIDTAKGLTQRAAARDAKSSTYQDGEFPDSAQPAIDAEIMSPEDRVKIKEDADEGDAGEGDEGEEDEGEEDEGEDDEGEEDEGEEDEGEEDEGEGDADEDDEGDADEDDEGDADEDDDSEVDEDKSDDQGVSNAFKDSQNNPIFACFDELIETPHDSICIDDSLRRSRRW